MQENVSLDKLPTPQDLKERAASGHQFTREEVRNLTEQEMMATGASGPIRKGPAATIQSIYEDQQRFADKTEELVVKEEPETRTKDAKNLHSWEVSSSIHRAWKFFLVFFCCHCSYSSHRCSGLVGETLLISWGYLQPRQAKDLGDHNPAGGSQHIADTHDD